MRETEQYGEITLRLNKKHHQFYVVKALAELYHMTSEELVFWFVDRAIGDAMAEYKPEVWSKYYPPAFKRLLPKKRKMTRKPLPSALSGA